MEKESNTFKKNCLKPFFFLRYAFNFLKRRIQILKKMGQEAMWYVRIELNQYIYNGNNIHFGSYLLYFQLKTLFRFTSKSAHFWRLGFKREQMFVFISRGILIRKNR